MAQAVARAHPLPRRASSSSESGFFDVTLSLENISARVAQQAPVAEPEIPVAAVKVPVVKKTSLKKKSSGSVFDGALHMGYLWYFNQNTDKRTPEEILFQSREEKLGRILRLDPQSSKNKWRRYFAVIWSDGRFAWYKPEKLSMYNKRLTAELEEVLFVPWRECAFGSDVIRKICSSRPPKEGGTDQKSDTSQLSPKFPLSTSPPRPGPEPSWTSFLESATKGLCICTSPSVVSLIVPVSPATSGVAPGEELVCILPKTSKDSLLIAVAGEDWQHGEVYCFASESQDDLELWRDSFALLTHRKTVQKSAFDHLLNTPVVITLPSGAART